MTEIAQKTASILNMLPAAEQQLAYEFMKRMVLAWDPDFTHLTDVESESLKDAEKEMNLGETISDDNIDWDNM